VRSVLVSAVILTLAVAEVGADAPTIPQDPAAQARRRAGRLAWHRATTVEAYDRVGGRDPKWDSAARLALSEFANSWAAPGMAAKDHGRAADAAATEALAAGCTDPLVKYIVGRRLYGFANSPDAADKNRLLVEAARELAASKYPAVRKAHALVNAAVVLARPAGRRPVADDRRSAMKALDDCLALVPEILNDPHPEARRQAVNVCETALTQYAGLEGGDWDAGLAKVRPAVAGGPKADALAGLLIGYAEIRAAGQARGKGFANTITEAGRAGWQLHNERARAAFEAAWKADPTDPESATGMIRVCLGLTSPRDEMETWFRRAMAADGDYRDACAAKLQYILPKWHGTAEDALAFGRACVGTGNYDADIPFELIAVHLELAAGTRADQYLAGQPGAWAGVQQVMTEAIKRHPESNCLRTACARWAAQFGQWEFAGEQFRAMGADYWRPAFATQQEAEQFIDRVRRAAGG
jgi:hypothetical protein